MASMVAMHFLLVIYPWILKLRLKGKGAHSRPGAAVGKDFMCIFLCYVWNTRL